MIWLPSLIYVTILFRYEIQGTRTGEKWEIKKKIDHFSYFPSENQRGQIYLSISKPTFHLAIWQSHFSVNVEVDHEDASDLLS